MIVSQDQRKILRHLTQGIFHRSPELIFVVRQCGRCAAGPVSRNLNLAVEVSPAEIRWADEILKARNAVAEAHRLLDQADAATQRQFRPLLDDACA
jgi:hypothetical protein